MMETLFCYNTANEDKNKGQKKKEASSQDTPQYIQIINSKKAQNLSILLKALNVTTEEVCDALLEGDYFFIYVFLLQLLIVIIFYIRLLGMSKTQIIDLLDTLICKKNAYFVISIVSSVR